MHGLAKFYFAPQLAQFVSVFVFIGSFSRLQYKFSKGPWEKEEHLPPAIRHPPPLSSTSHSSIQPSFFLPSSIPFISFHCSVAACHLFTKHSSQTHNGQSKKATTNTINLPSTPN
jgi:hypothetical protein